MYNNEHNYYIRQPIVSRPNISWPNGAGLALGILVCVEYYEMQPPSDAFIPPNVPGGFGRGPYPDFRSFSLREYGNRVGLFRVLSAIDEFEIPASFAIDAWSAAHRPEIVEEITRRNLEIVGHGQTVTRVISSAMTEEQEREFIASSLDTLESVCGYRPVGWHGAEYGESARTPKLLAEQGIKYVLDWPNDEQPYEMTTEAGRLISIPVSVDLDDVLTHYQRKISMTRWRQSVLDAIDQLLIDSEHSGRVLILNLHPWMIGQPFRFSYLEEVLTEICRRSGIWTASIREIANEADIQVSTHHPNATSQNAAENRPSRSKADKQAKPNSVFSQGRATS